MDQEQRNNPVGKYDEKLPVFLDRKQLCNRWNKSMSSIKRMEKDPNNLLNGVTFGKRGVRFRRELIIQIENIS